MRKLGSHHACFEVWPAGSSAAAEFNSFELTAPFWNGRALPGPLPSSSRRRGPGAGVTSSSGASGGQASSRGPSSGGKRSAAEPGDAAERPNSAKRARPASGAAEGRAAGHGLTVKWQGLEPVDTGIYTMKLSMSLAKGSSHSSNVPGAQLSMPSCCWAALPSIRSACMLLLQALPTATHQSLPYACRCSAPLFLRFFFLPCRAVRCRHIWHCPRLIPAPHHCHLDSSPGWQVGTGQQLG